MEQGLSCSWSVFLYPAWFNTYVCFCAGFPSTARPCPLLPLVLLQGDSEVPGCQTGGLARALVDRSTQDCGMKLMYLKKGSKGSDSCCGDDLREQS